MKKNLVHAALALTLSAAAVTAQAAPLTHNGFANGSVNVNVGQTNLGTSVGAAAGAFSVTWDGDAFLTYCVELTQYAQIGQTHDYVLVEGASYFDTNFTPALGQSGAAIIDRLGKLFTHLGGIATPATNVASAAIQLAVWELIYDATPVSSLSAGLFQENTGNAGAREAANVLLAGAAAVTESLFTIDVLRNSAYQDYLVIRANPERNDVPAPATLALVSLGLLGIGAARRRKTV